MTDADFGLFENERETNLESTSAMVEDVLVELGHFINNCRLESTKALQAWVIKKGSAEILISLLSREDFTHLRAEAIILTLDDDVDRGALFSRLLELNDHALCGAAFGLRGDQVRLVSERSTLDLDRSEVYALISQVRSYADDYDDGLVSEFGGALGGSATG